MAKPRVAFLECGQISQLHAAAYRDCERAEFVELRSEKGATAALAGSAANAVSAF